MYLFTFVFIFCLLVFYFIFLSKYGETNSTKSFFLYPGPKILVVQIKSHQPSEAPRLSRHGRSCSDGTNERTESRRRHLWCWTEGEAGPPWTLEHSLPPHYSLNGIETSASSLPPVPFTIPPSFPLKQGIKADCR